MLVKMSSYGFRRFFSLTVLLVLVQQGTSRKCYVCKSDRNGPCGYPTTTNGATVKECARPDELCYHYDYNLEGLDGSPPQYVERGCSVNNKSPCFSQPTHDVTWKCDQCGDSDLCNNQPTFLKTPKPGGGNNTGDGDGSSSLHIPYFVIISLALITILKNI